MRKVLFISGVILAGLAAACTLAPRDTGTSFMFALEPAKTVRQGPQQKEILIVAAPTAAPELDTYRISLKKDGRRWDYYEGARWPDFLPVVVQDDLTKTLGQAQLFKAVTTDESGISGEKVLKTEIKTFQAEYTAEGAPPVVKISMNVSLVSRLERIPLASFSLSAEKKASGNNLSAIQIAFAAAFDDVQHQLVGKLAACPMTPFQIIAVLLTFVAIGGYINHKYFRLPETIGHMAFALLLSLSAIVLYKLGLFDLAPVRAVIGGIDFSEVLLHGMLSFLLFAGALQIRFDELKEVGTSVAVLATAGVVIATLVTGTFVWKAAALMGLDIPYIYALLFGALISPTDPIAVLAILKDAGLSKKLFTKVGAESLFNDGVGVVVFLTILGIALGERQAGFQDVAELVVRNGMGGLALGFVLGGVTDSLLHRLDDYKVEVLLTLALVTGGYALAEFLHLSAPICMVAAGLVVGNQEHVSGKQAIARERLDLFWELLDEIFNAILFMLIGLEVIVITITAQHMLLGIFAIVAVLLGRLISVSLPIGLMSLQQKFERGTIPILVWGGLRGGLSIAMALSLPAGPEKSIILPVTYIVVLFSVLVQGLSFQRFLLFMKKWTD